MQWRGIEKRKMKPGILIDLDGADKSVKLETTSTCDAAHRLKRLSCTTPKGSATSKNGGNNELRPNITLQNRL